MSNVFGSQLRNGGKIPVAPPVQLKLYAISWKMKKMAMVTTTKVCRRTRSAIRPNGTATAAAARPATGYSAKTTPPTRFRCLDSSATV